ncbi:MAG: hypothetical protein QM778_12300 [Myxococcales bacterium]
MAEPREVLSISPQDRRRGTKGGCLLKVLIALGSVIALLGAIMAINFAASFGKIDEIRDEAISQSNAFFRCGLALDEACVRAHTADWPPEEVQRVFMIFRLVNERLGPRGDFTFDPKSLAWNRNVGTGPGWRVQLAFKTRYAKADQVVESFLLVGEMGAMRVQRFQVSSDLLLQP